jgi:hypothetical protein
MFYYLWAMADEKWHTTSAQIFEQKYCFPSPSCNHTTHPPPQLENGFEENTVNGASQYTK